MKNKLPLQHFFLKGSFDSADKGSFKIKQLFKGHIRLGGGEYNCHSAKQHILLNTYIIIKKSVCLCGFKEVHIKEKILYVE